jgi:hypothetical protein
MIYIGCDVSEKSSYVYVTDGKGKKSRAMRSLQIRMAIGSILKNG